jgi:transcription-repair coupling factor (superfamily II helicase)
MDLRRVLKTFLVQQISASDGKVFMLFHSQSPVKVEKLLELIKKDRSRYRLSPDGRLSFTPQTGEWQGLIGEVIQLLHAIQDSEPELALNSGLAG